MRKFTTIMSLLLLFSMQIIAGGYQVGLHGIKQIGMGLVGTSLARDASTLFYNPGGLPFMTSNYSFAAGVSGIRSYTTYKKAGSSMTQETTDNPWGTPFYFYGATKINERISAGLAINTPYGNSLSWGKEWSGRYLIQDLSLKAIFFQPSVAFKINNMIGIGAGLVYATGDFEMNKALPVYDAQGEGSINLKGSTSSFGFNAGIILKPIKNLNIGLDYRSSVDMKVKNADVTFDVPLSLQGSFPNTKVSTKLPLPANLDFGLSYNLNEKLLLAMSLNYVFWSSYDSLIFDFKDNTPSLADSRNPRLYSDKLIIRVGAEYKVCHSLDARVGGYYDPSPVNSEFFSPETPSLNSLGLTAGLSISPNEKLSIDLSFLFISGQKSERQYTPDNFSGTFKTYTYIPGIGLTYNF